MLPQNNGHATESAERERVRVQKKSWRASKVLANEQDRLTHIKLLTWTTTALERLQSELTFLDTRGKGLYDTVFADQLNPFFKCRMTLANMLHGGKEGPLRSLFDTMPEVTHSDLLAESSRMLLSFLGQGKWRFLEFETYPRRWAAEFHPARCEADGMPDII